MSRKNQAPTRLRSVARSYGQYCAVAKSLDLVGDRWTLLIVRELLDGPCRYSDLLGVLAPIATDMLAARLRDLEANGLIERHALSRLAAGRVYVLTADGQALEEVVDALARWGRSRLGTRDPGDTVHPQWLVRALRAFADPNRPDIDVVLRLALPEGDTTLRITARDIEVTDAAPDVTLTGAVENMLAAMDPARLAGMRKDGAITVQGGRAALRQLSQVFGPAPAATAGTSR
jgi:DNA-binding HxlR family transcriptional regulator